MKVLLVNPISHTDYDRTEGVRLIPYGLLYLAAYGRRRGHEFRILDRNVDFTPLDDVLPTWRPDVVGLTAMTGPCLSDAMAVANHVRSHTPSVRVVWGGVHPTLLYEQVLGDGLADVVVRREGEQTLAEVLQRFESGRDIDDVPGIAFRRNADIVTTPPRPLLEDLNDLPDPAWDLVPIHRYSFFTLNTSRGCPFRCTFCYNRKVNGPRRAELSAERVVTHVRYLQREYGATHIDFLEDNFTARWPRVQAFCRQMIEANLGVTWACEGRVSGMSPERLAMLKRAGCTQVRFGAESGSQRILDFLKKDITVEQIERVLTDSRKIGLGTGVYLINGIPTETAADRRASLRLLRRTGADYVDMTTYRPYPGTELYDVCIQRGLFDPPTTTREWARISDQYDPRFDVTGAGWRRLRRCQMKAHLYTVRRKRRDTVRRGVSSAYAWKTFLREAAPIWLERGFVTVGLPAGVAEDIVRSCKVIGRRVLIGQRSAGGPQRPIGSINVETSRACNLKCIQCAVHANGRPDPDRGKLMSVATFSRLLPILKDVDIINLDNHGEPLINPHLEEMIALAKKSAPHIKVSLTSNFTLMTRARAASLLDAGADEIQVSVNGTTKETFEKIMTAAHFGDFVNSLAAFSDVRRERADRTVLFAACVTAMRSNLDELVGLPEFLAPYGIDMIRINSVLPFDPDIQSESLYDDPRWNTLSETVFAKTAAEGRRYGIAVSRVATRPRGEGCTYPTANFGVACDGTVSPCWMLDIKTGYTYHRQGRAMTLPFVSCGNIVRDHVQDIWNCKDYVTFRRRFHQRKPPEYCQSCPVGQGLICG